MSKENKIKEKKMNFLRILKVFIIEKNKLRDQTFFLKMMKNISKFNMKYKAVKK